MKKITLFGLVLLILSTTTNLFGQTETNKASLLEFSQKKALEFQQKKAEALKFAQENNIPVIIEDATTYMELMYIDDNGFPQYYITNNGNSSATISTNKVNTGGGFGYALDGNGMTVHEWDGAGVRATHQEFGGRVNQVDNPSNTSFHSTHVAGTLIASGVNANAKGMAPAANLDAYDWNYDESEVAAAGANGALVSNHSYGYVRGWNNGNWHGNPSISTQEDYKFGFYDASTREWDQLAYDAPYLLICKSAGNDRGQCGDGSYPCDGYPDGYDCIGQRGSAKNNLVVAAVHDIPAGYSQPSDVVITVFSSWGPPDDGRIKPDIAANGWILYSCDDDNDADYGYGSGTSMSAPSVAGSLILLQEHYENLNGSGNYMRAATLKGLIIHTADEAGSADGPDYKFGWGLMNTYFAAELISSDADLNTIEELALRNNKTYQRTVMAAGGQPLKVTLVWTDLPGTPPPASLDPPDPMVVHELDLRLTESNNTFYPWKLDKDNPSNAATRNEENDVDNVEMVTIDNPTGGTQYTVIVDHDGAITKGSQAFSLIVSGITNTVPQAPVADFEGNPTTITVGNSVNFTDLSLNNPTSWDWTFAGGTPATSTEQNPTVIYNTEGTYEVSLTATNGDGSDTETKLNYISVVTPQPPVADFSGEPTTVTVGNSVNFTDLSLNNPTSWEWTFVGGTPASNTEQNPTVTYNAEGTYAVSLIATNGEGSDTITVTDYITVNPVGPITYCESSSQSNAQEWIAQVDIGGFSNPSGASLYSDFTGQTVTLSPGSNANVALTPVYTGKNQREFWRIWIDYNIDGDFEDSGEQVFVANNKKGSVTGTMSIPATANGQTRMRITMKNGSSPGPCETFLNGEVEDYTVDFMAGNAISISQTYYKDLVIFPNPNNGRFQVKIEKESHPQARLKVYDMKGMLRYDMPVSQSLLELDLSELSAGIYHISVINSNEYYYSKLVKQ